MRWGVALGVVAIAACAIWYLLTRPRFGEAVAIPPYVPNKPVPLENKAAPLTPAERVVAPLSAETTTSSSSGLPAGSTKSLLKRVGSDV